MDKIKQIYNIYVQSNGIALCIVTISKDIIISYPSSEPLLFTEAFLDHCIQSFDEQKRDFEHPLIITLNPIHYIGVARVAVETFLIYGPVVPFHHNWKEILEQTSKNPYMNSNLAYQHTLSAAPVLPILSFIASFSVAIYLYTGHSVNVEEVTILDRMSHIPESDEILTNYLLASQEEALVHTPQNFEERISHAIETGDLENLKKCINESVPGRLGILSYDHERQMKYMFVTVAAVCARAAMRGGLSYELACSMADINCQQMDTMTDPLDIMSLQISMILSFCTKVAESGKLANYSITVQTCCDYIDKHLHDKITLGLLSTICTFSPRRLSEKFLKETGVSIGDYINYAKMREAKYLLKYTNHSVSEISNYLSYSSQSYFTKIFKQVYGVTPQVYQKKQIRHRGSPIHS